MTKYKIHLFVNIVCFINNIEVIMKNKIINLCLILALFGFVFNQAAAEENKNVKEVKVQTNLHCGSCKAKIEDGLKTEKGILKTNTDVKSKVVTVSYNADETTSDNITKAIANLGYTAKSIDGKGCCDGKEVKGECCSDKKADCKTNSECKSKASCSDKKVKTTLLENE